ncbi:DSD1 family PLP-dependent enzyme [Inhella gelatinilytica]|uniref:DSD1 family PLP-dependent enzyme n=1 Tax=Inhella gelatinilytica TaxID=2795030 RepID=A0A931IVI3_9BURK|nr:DSD1 family PLP-dependent enzyme [Inhella gelatinilytica]MBH9552326.1 DSD1 family PLP-dependent enzyme [Inhella gelatinilytica]
MASPLPPPGTPVSALPTPTLVVDLDALERNIAALAAFAQARGLRLRPHAKTHKCAAIARLQLAAGAVGVCVQKLSEAEALADAGIDRLYLSNQLIDPARLGRAVALAHRVQLALAVDSPLGVERLATAWRAGAQPALDVFVEVDIGQGRCGVPPAQAGALALQVVAAGLRFAGLQAYQGKAQHVRSAAARSTALAHAAALTREAVASVQATGLRVPLVTGAGTGSFVHEAASGLWGELQCGSYIFMDRDYADNEPDAEAPHFEHALFLKAQVISRSEHHAVLDAGHKSHAIDCGLPITWPQRWPTANGGDEHLILHPDEAPLPALGDTVWLIPGHCDPTVNLHNHLVAVRGGLTQGQVEAVWTVDARGCVQ